MPAKIIHLITTSQLLLYIDAQYYVGNEIVKSNRLFNKTELKSHQLDLQINRIRYSIASRYIYSIVVIALPRVYSIASRYIRSSFSCFLPKKFSEMHKNFRKN